MRLSDLAREVIETTVACGYDNRLSTFERVVAGVGGDESFDPEGRDRASVEETIEQAFARHEAAATTWPVPTDCDRLRRAFEALNADGIVSLEDCGFTLQDGGAQVTDVAGAREQLTDTPARGFCFFHRQDVEHAVAGEGLRLAFGSFETTEPPAEAAQTCSTCGGRGWIQPDPDKFPAPCPSHQLTRAPPRRTNAERIGDAIVATLSAAGFEVRWSGAATERIHLPAFIWRRRPARSSEENEASFLSSWELELRAGEPPREPLALVRERAMDWFQASPDLGIPMLRRFEAHTLRFLEDERAREARWSGATDNDRLMAVWRRLEAGGVLARECLGKTLLDAWAYAGLQRSAAHRGVVFFHDEDVIDAAAGAGLWLSFAALPADTEGWETRSAALGRELAELLDAHGLSWEWSGSARERILVRPFTWQRRRWTTPPEVELRTPRAVVPTRAPGEGPPSDRGLGEVVVGLVNEGGYELRRARRFRQAWQAAGHPGPAQVGHLGKPHAFVRAGERTTMMPVSAFANVVAAAGARDVAAAWPPPK